MNSSKLPSLPVVIAGSLTIWALLCFALHGPAIFAYIGLQAITSGVFAYAFWRTEKEMKAKRAANVAKVSQQSAPEAEVKEESLAGAA